MKIRKFDRHKFDDLVHYIIWKCPDAAKLGSVKLHKILWKSDTGAFVQLGHPITGARYVKRSWGPTADALLGARDRLAAAGKIKFWRDDGFVPGYSKDVYQSLKGPPEGFLMPGEREIVDYWINEICLKHTAASISKETHGYDWEIAAIGEELPMESVLAERGRDPEGKELEWAKEQARKRGLV